MSESIWKKDIGLHGWKLFVVGLGTAVISSQIAKALQDAGSMLSIVFGLIDIAGLLMMLVAVVEGVSALFRRARPGKD